MLNNFSNTVQTQWYTTRFGQWTLFNSAQQQAEEQSMQSQIQTQTSTTHHNSSSVSTDPEQATIDAMWDELQQIDRVAAEKKAARKAKFQSSSSSTSSS